MRQPNEGRPVGTLDDRDIATRVVAEGKDPASTPVREVASTNVVTEDGRLVGVVAQADVARRSDEQQTGELVGQISKESSP
jgi:CBS domain-containing protein